MGVAMGSLSLVMVNDVESMSHGRSHERPESQLMSAEVHREATSTSPPVEWIALRVASIALLGTPVPCGLPPTWRLKVTSSWWSPLLHWDSRTASSPLAESTEAYTSKGRDESITPLPGP